MVTVRAVVRRLLPPRIRLGLRRLVERPPAVSTPVAVARDPSRHGPNEADGIRRVHVGCGPTNQPPDWWNVDIREFPGVDQVVDATRAWPWTDLDAVYGEHFIEHLPLEGALQFANEAARALRPGGVLRLSTPGLEHVWVTHFHPSQDRAPETVVMETYMTNRAFHGWGHEFLYSKPMLERLLLGAGFDDLTFHDYGASDRPELRDLEKHPGWDHVEGWPSLWIVEAVRKPGDPQIDAAVAAEIETEYVRYVRSGH